MARIRSIHPGLFTDEAFAALSSDAQMFLIGLWTEADDQGMFDWKPVTLRMRLRPTKDGSVDGLLSELSDADCIAKFEINGRMYGAIRNFRKFQRPKKPNAIHPMTDDVRIYVALTPVISELEEVEDDEVLPDAPSGTEKVPQMEDEGWRMKDEGGKEDTSGVASRPPAVLSPEFIRIPTNRFETSGEEVVIYEAFVMEFQKLYPKVDVGSELRKMRAWSITRDSERKTKKGMKKFINGWLARQQDKPSPRETSTGGRNGGQPSNSFGSTVSRVVSDRHSGGLFSDRGAEIVVAAGGARAVGDRDEDRILGRDADAA